MLNRIIVHNIQFDGLVFLGNPNISLPNGYLYIKEFGFYEQPSLISRSKYAMRHGSYIGPAEKDNRTFKLLFDIVAPNEEKRWELLKKVKRAFSPIANPSPTNPNLWKKLSYMDVEGKEWEVEVQVNQGGGPQLSDFNNDQWVGISAQLIARTPDIYTKEIQTLEDRNHIVGFKVPSKIPGKMALHNELVEYFGAGDAPLDVSITASIANATPFGLLTVYSKSDGGDAKILQIENIDLQYGDQIEVDGINQLVFMRSASTGNRVDITGLATINSIWPLLSFGENILAVDCGLEEEALEVVRSWREVF